MKIPRMTDNKVVEMAVLVVLVATLLAAILLITRWDSPGGSAIATALVGLVGAVVAALLAVVVRPPNQPPPRP